MAKHSGSAPRPAVQPSWSLTAPPPGETPGETAGEPAGEPPTPRLSRVARRRAHRRRRSRIIASAVVGVLVVAVTAIGGTVAAMAKTVTISVDGATRQVTTMSATVRDALAAADLRVGAHDVLAPAATAAISDGSKIVIRRGRLVTLTIDGTPHRFWTTATTVGAALAQLGRDAGRLKMSADRSRRIPLTGLRLTASTLHTVTLADRDGAAVSITTAAPTVGALLREQGIERSADRMVTPEPGTPLTDGLTVTVRHLPTVTLVSDGQRHTVISEATTVGGLLAARGITVSEATRVTPRLSTPLTTGLVVTVTELPSVSVEVGAHKPVTVIADAGTVGKLLAARDIGLGRHDTVRPGVKTPLRDGMSVTVTRVSYRSTTETSTISQPADEVVEDDSMAKGTSRITQDGHPGELKISYRTKVVNGKAGKRQEVSRTTVTEAVPTIIHVGTYVAPSTTSAAPSTTSVPDARSSSPKPSVSPTTSAKPTVTSPAEPDTSGGPGLAVWEQIAQCESTNNWHINTGNGYYGGLQFDIPTWLANGGGQYAPRADLATKAQQIDIANRTYAHRGLSPWQCAYILGLI